MKIVKYKNIIVEIHNLNEFNTYIKENVYKDFIKTPDYLIDYVKELINEDKITKTRFIKSVKKIFSENNKVISNRQVKYWLNRGYDELNANLQVSNIQKINSPRHIFYWINRGYDHETANKLVSENQKKFGNYNKLKSQKELRILSNRCVEYWMNMGYTKVESSDIISKQSASYHTEYWKTATPDQKNKQRMSGRKNGMYGRPAPNGSGNGYSGWYRGTFFRSLHELNYIVNILDRFNIKFESAETKHYRMKYTSFDGTQRTYTADFVVDNKYLVEIKPKSLWNSKIVQLKLQVGELFCIENNLKYKLVDVGKMDISKLKKLYDGGDVVFMKRYEKKFNEYLYV